MNDPRPATGSKGGPPSIRPRVPTARPWAAVALAWVLLTATACGSFLSEEQDCGESRFAGLRATLPPSAADVRESCDSFINDTYRGSFTMTPQDLAAFQAGTRIQNWQPTIGTDETFKEEAARAKSLLFGTFGDGAIIQDVLIDTSDPQRYKVYYQASNVD